LPGLLVHLGATVTCTHGGQALPTAPSPRVLVSEQPVVTMASLYTIAGCGFVPPGGNGPCATAQFTTAATRVFASDQPVLLQGSTSVCMPTGTPLIVRSTQTRVTGT